MRTNRFSNFVFQLSGVLRMLKQEMVSSFPVSLILRRKMNIFEYQYNTECFRFRDKQNLMLCVKLNEMIYALEHFPNTERHNICLIVLSIFCCYVYSQSCALTMTSEKAPMNEQCTETKGSENMENSMAVVLYNEESVLPLHKRERTFKYCGQEITIKQDWSGIGVAAVVWDAVSKVFSGFNFDL